MTGQPLWQGRAGHAGVRMQCDERELEICAHTRQQEWRAMSERGSNGIKVESIEDETGRQE